MFSCRKVCDDENLTLATVKDLARVNIQLCSDFFYILFYSVYTHSTYFSVVVKTNINNYAERWCAYIKADYTSEGRRWPIGTRILW